MGTRAPLLPAVASPGRETLGNAQSGQHSACPCKTGGIKLVKDVNDSKLCDLGQARSLLALLRAGAGLSPGRCPQQQGLNGDSVCVTVSCNPGNLLSSKRGRHSPKQASPGGRGGSVTSSTLPPAGSGQASPSHLHSTPCRANDGGLGVCSVTPYFPLKPSGFKCLKNQKLLNHPSEPIAATTPCGQRVKAKLGSGEGSACSSLLPPLVH